MKVRAKGMEGAALKERVKGGQPLASFSPSELLLLLYITYPYVDEVSN